VRVLVVEDDPSQRRLLELVVRGRGHEPVLCATLAEARSAPPCDLALVDRRLPDGDGLELARQLSVPVYLLTGEEGGALGGIPHLTKPVRAADFDRILPID